MQKVWSRSSKGLKLMNKCAECENSMLHAIQIPFTGASKEMTINGNTGYLSAMICITKLLKISFDNV